MPARFVLLLIALILVVPAPAGAEEVIAVEQARVYADTWDGRTAWSSFDATARVWHLVTSQGGEVVRTAAPSASHPFRLDVGPGPDGRPVAVYPRCTEQAGIPECDLYLYDFDSERERKLRGVSTKAASESLPSVWRSRIAFARRAGGVSSMFVSRLDGRRARPIPTGLQTQPAGPLAIELRGSRATFVWSRRDDDGTTETTLWLYRNGRIRLLDVTASDAEGSSTFVTPELLGRYVYYARPATGRGGENQLRRVHVRSRRVRFVRAPFRGVATAVWTGDRFLLSRALAPQSDDPEGECRPPGSDPQDTVCRLILGDPVRRWRRLEAGT